MAKQTSKRSTKARIKKTKKLKKGLAPTGINGDDGSIWPNRRDVLFRPDRLQYVRKLVRPEGCVFCSAREAGIKTESLLVATLGDAMLVLNKYPYNAGHLLVLPKRHVGSFAELTSEEAADIHLLKTKALSALTDLYAPAGFNLGLNLGAAAGAGIPDHLHWHIIPRWAGDANFFPLIAQTKVVVETLERTFERLVPYFRNENVGNETPK